MGVRRFHETGRSETPEDQIMTANRRVVIGLSLLAIAGAVFDYWVNVPYRKTAQRCLANLRTLGSELLRHDPNDSSPIPSLKSLIRQDRLSIRDCQCPFRRDPSQSVISYEFVQDLRFSDRGDWIVAFDEELNHGRPSRSVLYLSGAVKTLSEEQFRKEWLRFATAFGAMHGGAPRLATDKTAEVTADRPESRASP